MRGDREVDGQIKRNKEGEWVNRGGRKGKTVMDERNKTAEEGGKRKKNMQPLVSPKAQWYDGESTLIKGTEAAKASRMRGKEW